MRFFHRISGLLLSALMLSPAAAAAAAESEAELVSVLVSTAEDADPAAILASLPGASLTDAYTVVPAFAAEVPAYLLDELAQAPGVTAVDRDASFLAPQAELLGTFDPSMLADNDLVIRSQDPDAGAGTVIAVLDSGFDVSHPMFAMTESAAAKAALSYGKLCDIAVRSYAFRPAGQDAANLWHSVKIPFAFDYDGRDTDVTGRSAHGTHVAATAAGSAADGAPLASGVIFTLDTGSGRVTEVKRIRF